MSFITLANTNSIIFKSNIQNLNLKGEIYKFKIYFFSKYEENALLAIQELLKNPEYYFKDIYVPYKPEDTYTLVYEGQKPSYHKYACCPRLQSDYQNFEIPIKIIEQGNDQVQEFRRWFETVKHLLDNPEIFAMRLHSRWGIVTNPKAINRENSGITIVENYTIKEIEEKIDELIKAAGRFYYDNNKNTTILKQFSKLTNLAYKSEPINRNDTGYSDSVVKELLKFYDEEYKKPLKKYLIEYYRLKFNPNIKMEGYLLEQLGFRPCSYCHDEDYKPEEEIYNEKKDQNLPDYISEDLPF